MKLYVVLVNMKASKNEDAVLPRDKSWNVGGITNLLLHGNRIVH